MSLPQATIIFNQARLQKGNTIINNLDQSLK